MQPALPSTAMNTAAIQRLVPELFRITAELEASAPGRHFTPDGHFVRSIDEVIAAARYGLMLTTASTKGVDAHDSEVRAVEIKAITGQTGAVLRGMVSIDERLIVLQISKTGDATEICSGPAAPAWEAAGLMQSNGQRHISLIRLKELQAINGRAAVVTIEDILPPSYQPRLRHCIANNSVHMQ